MLDLFDGGEKDRSSVNFDQGERRDRTLEYDTYEQRSDESLVDDYLEKNSLVDCSSATIPLLKPKKKKTRKSKKNTSRKERLEGSKPLDTLINGQMLKVSISSDCYPLTLP